MDQKDKHDKKLVSALDIALEALELCENIHERTGANKIPLDDIAAETGYRLTKKQIQDGFWLLVAMGIIGDDGDEDHMNYSDDNNELTELLKKIKIQELNKDAETPEMTYY
ncbi:MAG: hypothetical protein ACFFD1_14210 [Candidatus Thorarchaeota archaeon]